MMDPLKAMQFQLQTLCKASKCSVAMTAIHAAKQDSREALWLRAHALLSGLDPAPTRSGRPEPAADWSQTATYGMTYAIHAKSAYTKA